MKKHHGLRNFRFFPGEKFTDFGFYDPYYASVNFYRGRNMFLKNLSLQIDGG